mmetsp:Transcript_4481/g.12054  ORF Transcript_4481/g.12054 Transcript_4481/m.12054 type:complete len:603 (-) Transcript_4481:593-2401(-)
MRRPRKLRELLTKVLRPALLLSALLSAANSYFSVSVAKSVNSVDDVVNLPSTRHHVTSRTNDDHLDVNVAVVVPFSRCQALFRLEETFEYWHKHPPCVGSHSPDTRLSLILYYSKDFDVDFSVKRKVEALTQQMPTAVRRCFDGMHFISAHLSSHEDTYPFGPCHQFYEAFPRLRSMRFTHWLLYEPDVIPLQGGWGDTLLNLANLNVKCRSWWQLGSWPMYRNKVDQFNVNNISGRDLHLNGNAVYCLLSAQFDEYRSLVQMKYPPKGCAGPAEFTELGGYDHALYRFRLLPENREYMEDKFDRFINDDFIMNFGESGYDVSNVLRKHPSTMLVHGKYAFAKPDMRQHLDQKYATHNISAILEKIYMSELQRKPSPSELQFFTRAFQRIHDDEDRMQCVLRTITCYCNRGNHKSLLSLCDGQVQRVFGRRSKAIITGLFIRFAQRMPGPEAIPYAQMMNSGADSCSSILEKLCRLPIFFCSETDHLIFPSTPWDNFYDELVYFVRRSIVTLVRSRLERFVERIKSLFRAERNCHSSGKIFSTTPANLVMESSYLAVCKNAFYNQTADMLSCIWKTNTLHIRRPYACAEDINVNQLSRQLDC